MNNQHRNFAAVALTAVAVTVAACASSPPRDYRSDRDYRGDRAVVASASRYGTVQSVESVPASDRSGVAGAVIGGVVGGVIGHQIGNGRGNDAATAAGAIGGAIVGHEIQEHKQEQAASRYRVRVRMRSGEERTFYQDGAGDLRVGQEVRIQDDQILR
jgi:outer membrane lipoprotein SlyB